MTMSLSSRNLILLMVSENMTTLVRRAVLSLFMTKNKVVDKEIYLFSLALDLFFHDNVPIIPEFDLLDAERQVKQLLELYQS
jgi:hypothetical protein